MKKQNKVKLKDEVRGCECSCTIDEAGNVADYGYYKDADGETVYGRVWPACKLLELLQSSDAEYRKEHKVQNLDQLVAELDLLAYARGVNLEEVFDSLWGGRGWRWTKAERRAAGDGWREYWEASDGVVEVRLVSNNQKGWG